MSHPPLCSFAGYVSEAGKRIIQNWYDSLPEQEHDEVQDTLNYLAETPIPLWKRPEFDKVKPPLHEVRCKANQKNHVLRVYGIFDPKVRGRFIMLAANESKKADHDSATQQLALDRLSLINQRRASFHGFVI
jgi:hypothetical protein